MNSNKISLRVTGVASALSLSGDSFFISKTKKQKLNITEEKNKNYLYNNIEIIDKKISSFPSLEEEKKILCDAFFYYKTGLETNALKEVRNIKLGNQYEEKAIMRCLQKEKFKEIVKRNILKSNSFFVMEVEKQKNIKNNIIHGHPDCLVRIRDEEGKEKSILLEIKTRCSNYSYFKTVQGEIEPDYYIQIQLYLYLLGIDYGFLVSYHYELDNYLENNMNNSLEAYNGYLNVDAISSLLIKKDDRLCEKIMEYANIMKLELDKMLKMDNISGDNYYLSQKERFGLSFNYKGENK